MSASSEPGIPDSHDSDSLSEVVPPLRTPVAPKKPAPLKSDSRQKKSQPQTGQATQELNRRPRATSQQKSASQLSEKKKATEKRNRVAEPAKPTPDVTTKPTLSLASVAPKGTVAGALQSLSNYASVSDIPTLMLVDDETDDLELEPVTISDRIVRHRNPISSFLTSTIFHTGLLLCLALWMFQFETSKSVSILASIDVNDAPEIVEEVSTEKIKVDVPDEAESPLEALSDATSLTDEAAAASEVPSVSMATEPEPTPTIEDAKVIELPSHTFPTGGGLEGREKNARARLAATRGGSAASEAAVEKGLQWIIQHQRTDGSWRFRHRVADCDCGHQGTEESTTAATGLALMSLLGAGYTHQAGPYTLEIHAGLDYLAKQVRYSKFGGRLIEGRAGMYEHAIATVALAEAYAMTGDKKYKRAVISAHKYILTAQHGKGGWRYNPNQAGDMAVTGWALMALKACEHAGVETDLEVWKSAKQFINSLSSSGGASYGYQTRQESPTCTAIGLLSQMYLGWHREKGALEVGTTNLGEHGVSSTDVYYNYYSSLAMHHSQAPAWKSFNIKLRDHLVATQELKGHQAGSWHFPDPHGKVGGRLYTTAMAIMTLEVYYRFMPLYDLKIGSKEAAENHAEKSLTESVKNAE